MIFQYTWRNVLNGEKTRTSRLRNNGDMLVNPTSPRYPGRTLVESPLGKVRWEVDKTYAVQPARGAATIWWAGLFTMQGEQRIPLNDENACPLYTAIAQPLRIKVTGLRREDVRQISIQDVKREGMLNLYEFIFTWVQMHDKAVLKTNEFLLDKYGEAPSDYLMNRPSDRYDAWVIDFELSRRES